MMLGRYSSKSPDTAVGRIYVGVDTNKRNAVGEFSGWQNWNDCQIRIIRLAVNCAKVR